MLCFLDTHSFSNKQLIPCGVCRGSTAQSPLPRAGRGTASARPCRPWPTVHAPLLPYGELVERVARSVGEDERLIATVGRIVVVEVEIGRELDHGLLRDAVEPQHVLVLDDARVVAVHLAPAVGVVASLHVVAPPYAHGRVRAVRLREELVRLVRVLRVGVDVQVVLR